MEQQQIKLNFSLDKTTPIVCEHCGGETFQEAVMIRKASKFLTGTTQDAIIPIPTFCCTKCGGINEEFYPKELKNQN